MRQLPCLAAALSCLLFAGGMSAARAQEPTYTVTLADKQTIHVQSEERTDAGGKRTVHVLTRPASLVKSDVFLDAVMTLDAQNAPDYCRVSLGPKPGTGLDVEALRTSPNSFSSRIPGKTGTLTFGAPLFSPLIAELFIGRLYDWKRGGPQTFAMFVEEGVTTTDMITLKLTALPGTETLELPDGPVTARKLRYVAPLPGLPADQHIGVIYVGPRGEMLRCDTAFFGIPITAKGPATVEENGRRFVLRFGPLGNQVVALRADRRAGGGWNVTLEIENGMKIAAATCDDRYQMTHLETPWHTGPFTADVFGGSQVRYEIKPSAPSTPLPTPSEHPWFLPEWFDSAVWETGDGPFAAMPVGATRDGDFSLIFSGLLANGPFLVERLPDTRAKNADGQTIAAHTYRFTVKHNPDEEIEIGKPVHQAIQAYDLFTDGSRLIGLIGNDGLRITRDGFEAWVNALPKPAATYQ